MNNFEKISTNEVKYIKKLKVALERKCIIQVAAIAKKDEEDNYMEEDDDV